MNYQETINYIADIISAVISNDKYQSFYIGKTDDLERRKEEHEKDGYPYTWGIAHGSQKVINQAEKDLIAKFQDNRKFYNVNAGGGGNPNATMLYLAVSAKINGIEDLLDDALPIQDLDNIEIPNK